MEIRLVEAHGRQAARTAWASARLGAALSGGLLVSLGCLGLFSAEAELETLSPTFRGNTAHAGEQVSISVLRGEETIYSGAALADPTGSWSHTTPAHAALSPGVLYQVRASTHHDGASSVSKARFTLTPPKAGHADETPLSVDGLKVSLSHIIWLVVLVALFSASQDIVLDAYRRELLPDHELGIGNSYYVNAYRLSSLVPGSLALILADSIPWWQVFVVVAAFMLVGIMMSLWMPEHPPAQTTSTSKEASDGADRVSWFEQYWAALAEFFQRRGVRHALVLLAFMLLYKLGDSMATALATPFYLEMGFSKTEIGTIAKVASLWSSIAGGVVGGLMMIRIGINRALWLFGVVQLASIFGFAYLAQVGHDTTTLFAVVSFEYLGVGLGTAAFVAFIARNTDKRYTATQLALLTSLMGIPRTFANAATGWLIESFTDLTGDLQMGYTLFFLLCAAVALPGMALLPWVAPWREPEGRSALTT